MIHVLILAVTAIFAGITVATYALPFIAWLLIWVVYTVVAYVFGAFLCE